jgi:thiol:disulfide interchange protein DsbD
MGLPLLVLGTMARSALPKPGPWMEAVKQVFGVMLLGVALWLLTPVLPESVLMFAWGLLLLGCAVFLHALDPLPHPAHLWQRIGKLVGVITLLYGGALLVGLLAGSRDPLQPLAIFRAQAASPVEQGLHFTPINSVAELEQQLAQAQQNQRPLLLDFYADWCSSCKEMDRFTFADPAVQKRLAGFTLLRADVTTTTPENKALLRRFELFGPPGIIVFDAQGKRVEAASRIVGFVAADAFLKLLGTLP